MTTYTVTAAAGPIHPTLSAGADDIVTFTASGKYLEIVNRDATNALWFCWTKDASTPPLPVAAAAGVEYVGPGRRSFPSPPDRRI